jgi:hypothetical protein
MNPESTASVMEMTTGIINDLEFYADPEATS